MPMVLADSGTARPHLIFNIIFSLAHGIVDFLTDRQRSPHVQTLPLLRPMGSPSTLHGRRQSMLPSRPVMIVRHRDVARQHKFSSRVQSSSSSRKRERERVLIRCPVRAFRLGGWGTTISVRLEFTKGNKSDEREMKGGEGRLELPLAHSTPGRNLSVNAAPMMMSSWPE